MHTQTRMHACMLLVPPDSLDGGFIVQEQLNGPELSMEEGAVVEGAGGAFEVNSCGAGNKIFNL